MTDRIYGKKLAKKMADGGSVGDASPELAAVANDFPAQSSDASAQPDAPQASNADVNGMADKAEAAQAKQDKLNAGGGKKMAVPSGIGGGGSGGGISIPGRAGFSNQLQPLVMPDAGQPGSNAPPTPMPMQARANGGLIGGARHYGKKQ